MLYAKMPMGLGTGRSPKTKSGYHPMIAKYFDAR
ncbi:MAG: hypothetical protein H6Q72_2412 [Firmicutes bacterium]|nr:hypothetical protein [Bacillota bacterium]